MKTLSKATLIMIVAVLGSYTTNSCSTGATSKGGQKSRLLAKQQFTDNDFSLWLLSFKFNY